MYELWERLKEIPHRILLLLRYIALEWKRVLGLSLLFAFLFLVTCGLAVSCAELASVKCHTYHVQSTVPTTGQPAIEDVGVCTDGRDK